MVPVHKQTERGGIGWYSLDRGRVGAYCQRTLVGTPGASHFSQVIHRRPNPASPHPARSLRVEGRGSSFQRVAPRGLPERVQEDIIMLKRIAGLLVIVLAVILVPAALPQMEPTPTVYTFVSQFNVPRANWAGYSEDTEKTVVPILEKLTASGTIIGWSTFEQVVHTPDGYTHGAAWESTSIAGLMKVLD